jgi:hypothetical protein
MYVELFLYVILPAAALFLAGFWVGRKTRGHRVSE